MEERIVQLEEKISKIQKRNRRVEADKVWETSSFRILVIVCITYIVASLVLYLIGVKNFLLAALVPTVGYFLSVQVLPPLKRWWLRHYLETDT